MKKNFLCPICSGNISKEDFSQIEESKKVVVLQGRIRKIYNPKDYNVSPFENMWTVTLYLRKTGVKYLKFNSKKEIEKYGIKEGMKIRCKGCLHRIDEKDVVFAIHDIEILES